MSDELELDADLRAWVERTSGATVTNATPIGRGASRQIWVIDLGGDPAVVRVDTGDGPVAGTALTLAREADAYRAVGGSGLPVPAVRAVHPEGRALLLDKATGIEPLDGLTDGERRSVAEHYGECLARLHQLELDAVDLGALATPVGADPTVADLILWRTIDATRSGSQSSPVVGPALDGLAATVPAATRASLCHGDAGPGNFLHEGGRVSALLDWEFAHPGDAHDDLAWVAVRNQLLGAPLDLRTVWGSWSSTTGTAVDPARVEWFRALVLVRMLVSCDSSIAWAGRDAPHAQVQVMLQPFLRAALPEALRRAGCPLDDATIEADALAAWAASPMAELMDPRHLDDLEAVL